MRHSFESHCHPSDSIGFRSHSLHFLADFGLEDVWIGRAMPGDRVPLQF
jgi:hypothetical protein